MGCRHPARSSHFTPPATRPPPQHYIPTLLGGVHGLGDQLACEGIGPTQQSWDNGRQDFYEYL